MRKPNYLAVNQFKSDLKLSLKNRKPLMAIMSTLGLFNMVASDVMGQEPDINLDDLATETGGLMGSIFKIVGIVMGIGLVIFLVVVVLAFARKKDDAGNFLIYWLVAIAIYAIVFNKFLKTAFGVNGSN